MVLEDALPQLEAAHEVLEVAEAEPAEHGGVHGEDDLTTYTDRGAALDVV